MDNFWNWWQHIPEKIDPSLVSFGIFDIRYYSLMYIVAFGVVYFLTRYRIKKEKIKYKINFIENLFLWSFVSVIIGGRLGYVLFYNFKSFIADPLTIVGFEGGEFTGIAGMSYHGGLIGIIIVALIYQKFRKVEFWKLADFFIPIAPLGYTFGRIGNFINGELFGRITDVNWGMYFPLDLTNQLRHPSQIYEAIGEGILLFVLLWGLRKYAGAYSVISDEFRVMRHGNSKKSAKKLRKLKFWKMIKKSGVLKSIIRYLQFDGALLSLYLISYGIVRFIIEYFREPDAHLGFVLWQLSMGQVLSIVMILMGIGMIIQRNQVSNK